MVLSRRLPQSLYLAYFCNVAQNRLHFMVCNVISEVIHYTHSHIFFLLKKKKVFENNSSEKWMIFSACVLVAFPPHLICFFSAFSFVLFFMGTCVSNAKALQPVAFWLCSILHIQASFTSSKDRGVSFASCAQRECIFRNPQENTWCWPCDDLLSGSKPVRNFTAWNYACSCSVKNSRGFRD